MTRITTVRNVVITEEPQAGDVMVEVSWPAPGGDGKHLRPIALPLRPITEYSACIAWAKEMADTMAHPIYVVPLNHGDILNTNRWTPMREAIANLNDQERGEVRAIVVTTCAEVMRDCDEPEVRAVAYEQLVKLKVVRP